MYHLIRTRRDNEATFTTEEIVVVYQTARLRVIDRVLRSLGLRCDNQLQVFDLLIQHLHTDAVEDVVDRVFDLIVLLHEDVPLQTGVCISFCELELTQVLQVLLHDRIKAIRRFVLFRHPNALVDAHGVDQEEACRAFRSVPTLSRVNGVHTPSSRNLGSIAFFIFEELVLLRNRWVREHLSRINAFVLQHLQAFWQVEVDVPNSYKVWHPEVSTLEGFHDHLTGSIEDLDFQCNVPCFHVIANVLLGSRMNLSDVVRVSADPALQRSQIHLVLKRQGHTDRHVTSTVHNVSLDVEHRYLVRTDTVRETFTVVLLEQCRSRDVRTVQERVPSNSPKTALRLVT
ncbi:hypothetical protein D3C85_127960 [compost metagenome]